MESTWSNIFPGIWAHVFKRVKIREARPAVLWGSWQFYSGKVWKSDRKEVQETEHNPKKTHTRTHKNTIRGDNKRGEGDRVGLVGASIEMLSVPDWASKLTVIWTGKRAEEQGKRDKWERKTSGIKRKEKQKYVELARNKEPKEMWEEVKEKRETEAEQQREWHTSFETSGEHQRDGWWREEDELEMKTRRTWTDQKNKRWREGRR